MSLITVSSEGSTRLVVKGASEMVLESCTHIHLFSNDIVPLDAGRKEECLAAIDSMAKDALRTLILAYKEITGSESKKN